MMAADVFRRRSDVRFRRLPPEGVVVRQTNPEVLVVNELGALVLERLDGKASFGTVVESLLGLYDVPRPVLERDITAFLDELLASGIIEKAHDDSL